MKYFCKNCGKVLRNNQRKYCGNSCKCKDFYKNNKEKCNKWNKEQKKKEPNNCKVCGVICGRRFYCSKDCKDFAYYFNDNAYWDGLDRARKRMKTPSSHDNVKKHRKDNIKEVLLKEKSRRLTLQLFNRRRISLPLKCSECSSIFKLEIHHEIYPQTREEIIEAVKNKCIYLLCKFCHANVNK